MAKINVNHDDCYFENKSTFEDLVNKAKALGATIKRNGGEIAFTGFMIGCVLFSASNIPKIGKDVIDMVDYFSTIPSINSEVDSSNDIAIEELNKVAILAADLSSNIKANYHIENNQLMDNEGNIISLSNIDTPICLASCMLSNETFSNMNLSSSKAKSIGLNFSAFDNDFVNYLPDTVEELVLDGCRYISNLDELPNRCPNIACLSLRAIPTLSDLSFIYRMPNLKVLYISDSAYVTEELLDYLKDNGITTNLDEKDIKNAKIVDGIIAEIIKPGMTDREKIQAVCLYVLNNVEYDISQTIESNSTPLSCVLEDGKGVCASYAYLTSVLLSKAGVQSYDITNSSHAWNAVKLEDKYYYIDTTNMDNSKFYNFLLETLNISKYYMIDTNATFISSMTSPDNKKTIMPLSLIEDIQKGRNDKDVFEKYGGVASNIIAALAGLLVGASGVIFPLSLKYCIEEVPFLFSWARDDYKDYYNYYSGRKTK